MMRPQRHTAPQPNAATGDIDSPPSGEQRDATRRRPARWWSRRPRLRGDWPVTAILLALAAISAWFALVPTVQSSARLAAPPATIGLSGFYSAEENTSFSFRWSRPAAQLTLPVAAAERYTITLRLADAPGAATPRALTILIDDRQVATLTPDSTLRDYRLDYSRPSGGVIDAPLRVQLRTTALPATGDPRELGIAVAQVRWGRAAPSLPLRAALLAAQLALLGLAYAALRALRAGRKLPTSLGGRLQQAVGDEQRPTLLFATLALWALPALLIDYADPLTRQRGYVALVLAGVVVLASRRAREVRFLHAAHALAAVLAAAWWQWALAPTLDALPQPYDQRAVQLVPLVIVLFAAATAALAWLLPPERRRPILAADLYSNLAAVVFTAAGLLSWRGGFTTLEQTLRVSWPGVLLILLIMLKSVLLGLALWRIAPAMASERRIALATLALCAAFLWSLLPWRVATMGLSGDEPAYLAAALSLARDRDLDLNNNGYDPWMAARTHYPNDAWVHEIADTSRDRFTAAAAHAPTPRHALPIVAGPGLRGEIGIANPGATDAAITLRIGRSGTPETFVLGPNASRLVPIPAADDWRDATVMADTPIAVAVRLTNATGASDAYGIAPPTNQFCLPLPIPAGTTGTLLFLRNDTAAQTTPAITRYDAAGVASAIPAPIIPASSTLELPLPTSTTAQTVCIAADQPLAGLALSGTDDPTLLISPASPATSGPLPIPPAPLATQEQGTVALIAHNPGDRPVRVQRTGSTQPLVTIPAHGTAQLTVPGSSSSNRPSVTLETDGPLIAQFLLTLDRNRAIVAPTTDGPTIWFPAIVGESRHFFATRVTVQNPDTSPLPVTVALLDDHGQTRESQQLALCGRCTWSIRLDFANETGHFTDTNGAIVVRADRPVFASVGQIDARSDGFFHSWGLPALIAAGALPFGVPGAAAIVAACAALLLAQLYGLLRDSGASRQVALATALTLGLAAPLLPFSLLLYPEIPAALLLVTGLRLALERPPLRGWRLGAVLACAIAITLLHTRLLPLAAILALCGGWHAVGHAALNRRARRWLLPALALPPLLVALWWLGSPWLPAPLALSARLSRANLSRYFDVATVGHHLAGVLLDRATGLLPFAPLLLLAPLGLLALLRRAPRYALWSGALIGLQFALVALRAEGWEVWGPPGRYILPVIPLLGLGIAAAWSAPSPRWLRYLGAALVAWGWAITAFYLWIPHAAYYQIPERRWLGDQLLRTWRWPNPLRLFPSIHAGLPFDPRDALPWLLLLLVITAIGTRWRTLLKSRSKPPLGG